MASEKDELRQPAKLQLLFVVHIVHALRVSHFRLESCTTTTYETSDYETREYPTGKR